jgi:hypothetical protein
MTGSSHGPGKAPLRDRWCFFLQVALAIAFELNKKILRSKPGSLGAPVTSPRHCWEEALGCQSESGPLCTPETPDVPCVALTASVLGCLSVWLFVWQLSLLSSTLCGPGTVSLA